MKIIGGGQIQEVKAITTIPGWSEVLNESIRKGEGKPANLYKQSVWANRCVNLKAEALAGIPWGFFVDEEEVERPNIARVLLEGSIEENWTDIMRGVGADLDIYGKAFLEKIGENQIVGINRLNANTVEPIIQKNTGEIVGFVQETENGQHQDFSRDQIIYLHTYNPTNDLIGLSALHVARFACMTEIKANEYLAAFFANSAMPTALLTTEQMMNDQDFSRVKRWWDKTFRGVSNQHKVGYADKGLKLQKLGYSNQELALAEVRAEARRDIAAVLGVPPALAGAWEAANYAASNEQRQSFYTETIIPRAEYIAGVLNAELVQQIDAGIKFGFKYMDLDVMQPDMVAERKSIALLVQMGVITPLAGALQLGYEPTDAGIGPIQTRIVDEDADIVEGNEPTQLAKHLSKWQRKAENSLSKGKGAQVDFESDAIPAKVNEVIYSQLAACQSKQEVSEVFGGYDV